MSMGRLAVAPSILNLHHCSQHTHSLSPSQNFSSLLHHTTSPSSSRPSPSQHATRTNESARIMPSSDDSDDEMPPVVRTAWTERIIAGMKRTMADPVAMAKVRRACYIHSPLAHIAVDRREKRRHHCRCRSRATRCTRPRPDVHCLQHRPYCIFRQAEVALHPRPARRAFGVQLPCPPRAVEEGFHHRRGPRWPVQMPLLPRTRRKDVPSGGLPRAHGVGP